MRVDFYDGTTVLSRGSISTSGVATFPTSSLTLGTHSIKAVFAGDTEHTGSTSATLTQTVATSGTATTTTITPSANPAYGGQSVTLTVKVTSASGTPTGTATVYESCAYTCGTGYNSIGNVTLTSGQGTLTTSVTTYGAGQPSYNFYAIYTGDSTFAASQSSTLTETVSQGATTVGVTSSVNPSKLGQSVTLTATVTPVTGISSFNSYGDQIDFYDGTTVLSRGSISTNGVASISTTSSLSLGTHTIKAVFNGDTEHTGSTSSTFTQTVNSSGTATTTTITPSANPVYGGQSVTLTVNVTGSGGTPTGTATVYESCAYTCGTGYNSIGNVTLTSGQGSLAASVTTYGAGQPSYNFYAIYSGDSTFASSQSATLTENVNQGATRVAVTSSANPDKLGQSVTFTATVTAVTGISSFNSYGDQLDFYDGTTVLSRGSIASNGVALFTTSALSASTHTISAVFNGDTEHTGSTSAVLNQVVSGQLPTQGGNKIGRLTTAGVFTEYTVPTSAGEPYGIATGHDGNLWFTEAEGNKIGKITTSGTITEYTVTTANSVPTRITSGPDNNLWFVESRVGGSIGRITTAGTITEFPLNANEQPFGIASGPDGNLWFTETVSGTAGATIGRITTSGTITRFAFGSGAPAPSGIVAGSDGALWFTELGNTAVGRVTTAGSVTNQYQVGAGSGPQGIVAGPDSALWFTNGIDGCAGGCTGNATTSTGNSIGRITTAGAVTLYAIPTSFSDPEEITVGSDGALWFAEVRGNKIGRITTAGAITEFTIPTSRAGAHGITLGPDNALWFTESGSVPGLTSTHDFNGDGRSDILWRDIAGDATAWMMASGGGIQGGESLGNIPTAWSVVGSRDFNGDGTSDILWRDSAGDTTIWFMKNGSVSFSTSLGNIPTAWSVVGTGDFNGDGYGDILWHDTGGDTTI